MSIPITSSEQHIYVQIPSATTSVVQNTSGDVHICGTCKQQFFNIKTFVEHKENGCTKVATFNQPSTAGQQNFVVGNSEAQQPLYRMIIQESPGEEQNGHQHQRIILQPVDSEKGSYASNINSSILRSRLLGSNESVLPDPQHKPVQCKSDSITQQVFDNVETDVATLLANQLGNEVTAPAVVENTSPKSVKPGTSLANNVVSIHQMETVFCQLADAANDDASKTVGLTYTITDVPTTPLIVDSGKTAVSQASTGKVATPPLPSDKKTPKVKKRHDCTVEGCTFTTPYAKDLVRHTRKHTGEKPFPCTMCTRFFSRADKLHTHMRIHTGNKPYRCSRCEYAAVDSGSLKKHMRTHTDERPYRCQICTYSARDSSQLTVHLRIHTGDTPFNCPVTECTSAFKTSSDLKRHLRMHTGEKPYECGTCGYRCAIKSNLKVHIKLNHTTGSVFACGQCDYKDNSKVGLKKHEKTHTSGSRTPVKKDNKEKKSTEKTPKKPRIKKENTATSPNKANVVANKTMKPLCTKAHKCTLCDAAFVREDSWRSHMRQHQNNTTSSLTDTKVEVGDTVISSSNVTTASFTPTYVLMAEPRLEGKTHGTPTAIRIKQENQEKIVIQGSTALREDGTMSEQLPPQSVYVYMTNQQDDPAEIIASLNESASSGNTLQPSTLLVATAGGGTQYITMTADQLGSLVNDDQISSPLVVEQLSSLQPGMQYVISTPMDIQGLVQAVPSTGESSTSGSTSVSTASFSEATSVSVNSVLPPTEVKEHMMPKEY